MWQLSVTGDSWQVQPPKHTSRSSSRAQKEHETMTGNATFTNGGRQATPNRNAALAPFQDWQGDWEFAPAIPPRDINNRNAALAGGYPGRRLELVANHALLQRSEALRAKDMDTFIRHWLGDARSQADWDRLMEQFTSRYGVALPRQFQRYSPEVARQLGIGGLPVVLHLVVQNHRHALQQARQATLAGQGQGVNRAASSQMGGGRPGNPANSVPFQLIVSTDQDHPIATPMGLRSVVAAGTLQRTHAAAYARSKGWIR
jgi:hypothetical protein